MFRRSWLLVPLTLAALGLAPPARAAGVPEPVLREILIHEQARNTDDGFLEKLTRDDNAQIRARAYRALGRLQELRLTDAVHRGFSDKDENVRLEAVFALGQIRDPAVEPHLAKALGKEEKTAVRLRLIEALGKCGNEATVARLAEIAGGSNREEAGEALIALGILGRRGFSIEETAPVLDKVLSGNDPDLRWKAAFAVFRGKVEGANNGLNRAVEAKDALTLIYTARAIGAISTGTLGERMLPLLEHEDWRVRVEALRAMGATNRKYWVGQASLLLDDPNLNVALTTVETMGKINGMMRVQHLEESSDWRWQSAYLKAVADASGDGALSRLQVAMRDPEWRVRRAVAEALAPIKTESGLFLLETMAQDESPLVVSAVATSLTDYPQRYAVEVLRKLLTSSDAAVLATAADGAGTRHDLDAAPALVAAYERLQSPLDTDVMVTILKSMGELLVTRPDDDPIGDLSDAERTQLETVLSGALSDADTRVARAAADALTLVRGKQVDPVTQPSLAPPPQFNLEMAVGLESGAQDPVARISTNRGAIVVRLLGREAPGTVANFIALVRDGYYNGLTFHRVVADFVIQGGDPRGDGFGGPGYAIRCEYNPLHYEQGRMGMALDGKDTGGSQFFITHSPQPHLDGNYTIFGEVLEGQEVVDKIQVGDLIQEITLEGI